LFLHHELRAVVACKGGFEAMFEKEIGSVFGLERMRLKIHKKGKGVSNSRDMTEEVTFGDPFGGELWGQLAIVLPSAGLKD
jgi:hypothetical protein